MRPLGQPAGRGAQAQLRRGICHNFHFHLARGLHCASCPLVPMAQTHKHHHSLAGTSFTKACGFGCAMMRLVAISNWNKTASAGFAA